MKSSSPIHSTSFQDLSPEERMIHVKNLGSEEAWAQATLLGDEWANSLTHAIGLILSFIGLMFLLVTPLQENDHWKFMIFAIYGGSLILLYATSTFYHAVRRPKLKKMFRTLDHCAIYILIAGSYTPFTMILLNDVWGWTLFGIVWSLAVVGIVLKVWFRHRFPIFSTSLYLFMGWLVVVAAEPLMDRFHVNGLYWLLAGGLCYTIGVVFYVLDKRRFYHAIWHLFVLSGSTCHYLSVLFYL